MEYDKIKSRLNEKIAPEKLFLWVMVVASFGAFLLVPFFWYYFRFRFDIMKKEVSEEKEVKEDKEPLDLEKLKQIEQYFKEREERYKNSQKKSIDFRL